MSDRDEELHDAYIKTRFLVYLDSDRTICIRAGECREDLDALLKEKGYSTWCFITADNPGSREQSVEENEAGFKHLCKEVERRDFKWLAGEGVGEADWSPEKSILVLGISREDSIGLGRDFGQNAIVWGENGYPAELVYCG